ncbi:hypothetical protein [Exiguobacterium undae]|uniref:hypothetical protein n=1 Tax=Exiguobacterium undae TaxID=169177 RepID=UPI0038515F9A
MTTLKFTTGVRFQGKRYTMNAVVNGFSKEETEVLVSKGLAFVVGLPSEAEDANVNGALGKSSLPPVDEESLVKELDANWTLKELKTDALLHGVDLEKVTSKEAAIKKIIEEGKADAFLSMLEDE